MCWYLIVSSLLDEKIDWKYQPWMHLQWLGLAWLDSKLKWSRKKNKWPLILTLLLFAKFYILLVVIELKIISDKYGCVIMWIDIAWCWLPADWLTHVKHQETMLNWFFASILLSVGVYVSSASVPWRLLRNQCLNMVQKIDQYVYKHTTIKMTEKTRKKEAAK